MRDNQVEHERELNRLRGRQLALIRTLSPQDAIDVLQAIPVPADEEQDVIANIMQRHILMQGLDSSE
jgi:hypothetical protein